MPFVQQAELEYSPFSQFIQASVQTISLNLECWMNYLILGKDIPISTYGL